MRTGSLIVLDLFLWSCFFNLKKMEGVTCKIFARWESFEEITVEPQRGHLDRSSCSAELAMASH